MELLYLLISITTTTLTSTALSLLLFLRRLIHRHRPSSDAGVFLYEGIVFHERRHPVRHSFSYPLRYALFDLDHAPPLLVPPDHLSSPGCRRMAHTSGPVFLLTIPPSVGYEQNPISLYYCYDLDGSNKQLKKCIAEVTNTPWGERVTFVFDPYSDLVPKSLHVSPFMDMLGTWNIRANDPGDSLSLSISVQHPELGDYFVATLNAKRVATSMISDHATFFWLMPHKVALWIYWHAFKLWWKNVQFIQHPRYTDLTYREKALVKDQKLQCCRTLKRDEDIGSTEQHEGSLIDQDNCGRGFKWRDAKWPWC